ncbi:MAG: ATP-binding protein [Candidatus Aenigmatarchaeota archaeon]
MHLGTVISSDRSPNSSCFSFVIDGAARKGQHVCVETDEGMMIGRIADVVKTNRYFERAESVKEFERSGKPLSQIFPAERWEYLVADVQSLGVYSDGSLRKSSFPPSPGSKVYPADNDMLTKFFGFDSQKGLQLGTMEHSGLPVRLSLTRSLQKHMAILGISGSGKSYCVADLIEELVDRKPEHGQVAVVVIDTHGEYSPMAEDKLYSQKTNVIKGRDFRIGVPALSADMVASLTHMSSVQRRELQKLLNSMREENRGKTYDLKAVIGKLEAGEVKQATKDILQTLLYDLDSTKLFGPFDNPSIDKLAKAGHAMIIDISDMTELREKQMVVTFLAKRLFHARMANAVPPFVFIVEEAHNFAPEGAKREAAISRGIIEKIAREGRKFHASLCLVSQRPIQLSTTALSQCNTHCILRVTNPYDLDHIGRSSEGLTADVLKTISSLRVGEALIVGEAVNYPLFLRIRERRSRPGDKGKGLEEAAIEFSSRAAQRADDAKAFM